MAIDICAHKKATNPTLSDGTTTNQLWALLQDAEAKLGTLEREGNRYWIRGITDTEQFPIATMKTVVNYGIATWGADTVEVHGYPCWLRLDDANKDDDVPAYCGVSDVIDTPAVVDDEGNVTTPAVTHTRTYAELFTTVVGTDGLTYAAATDGEEYFLGKILVQLDGETGVELVLGSEVPQPDAGE